MIVLAIGCHPDDLEVNAGGTLAKCAKRGDTVVMAALANGSAGHKVYSKEEIVKIRFKEATKAAAVIGAEYYNLGLDDMFVRRDYDEGVRRVSDLIRKVKPDFIITQGEHDYMVDHSITSTIVFDATMAATVAHYPSDYPPVDGYTPIFYMENLNSVNDFPSVFVDISDTIDTKIEMYSQHKSQVEWLKVHDNFDMCVSIRIFNRARGLQCDTGYVEGFTFCKQAHHLPLKRYLPE